MTRVRAGSLPLNRRRRARVPAAASHLEKRLELMLRAAGLPLGVEQYRFHPVRKWLLDRAWPDQLVAVEVQGQIWHKGGHSSGTGITRDCEKANEAILLGWRVVHFTERMILDGTAERVLRALLTEGAGACRSTPPGP